MGTLPSGLPDRRHVSGKTQSIVTAKVKALERNRDTGSTRAPGKTTVGAYVAGWIGRRERMGSVRPLTLSGYRTDLRHIEAAIGKVRLDKLGPVNIEYLWGYMRDLDLSVAHCRRTLNAALNDAVRRGALLRNPVPAAETPTRPPMEIQPYTVEQMTELLRAAYGTRDSARWMVAMTLGLRQGEVLGLCWDDVQLPARDGAEGTIVIRRQLQRVTWQHGCPDPSVCLNRAGRPAKRSADCPQRWGGGLRISEPKSNAGRRALTLPPTLKNQLIAHREAQAAERESCEVWADGPFGGWVFANGTGGPTDPRADARAFKDLCVLAGVPPKRLHDLRHSAATMMLASDLDLRTAGQVLGHSQLALTARYSHVLADRRSVAADRIEQTLFGKRS